MAIVYTKKSLVERVQRHLANNFPSDDSSLSETEVLLMIDQSLAFSMVGNVYAGAKVEGAIAVPEAYLTTYLIGGLVKNYNTDEWYASLPQPPVSLPLGYSVTNVYFATPGSGKSQASTAYRIKARRLPGDDADAQRITDTGYLGKPYL
jgi:hypothetical protein